MPECIVKSCNNSRGTQAWNHGLCLTCYNRAKRMVEAGATTWAELEQLGLAQAADGEATDPFIKAFSEAKAKQGKANQGNQSKVGG